MNNILVRTLSGAVFISLILVPLFLDSPYVAFGVFFCFMILGIAEYGRLFQSSRDVRINPAVNTFFSILISSIFIVFIGTGWAWVLSFVFPLFLIWNLTELWRRKDKPLLDIGVSVFGFMYVCVPLLIAVFIHYHDTNTFPLLAGMFILIWTNDTFAFLSGKFFGKTKLFERISPKKTWEGTIGGAVLTGLMAVGMSLVFDQANLLFWILSVFFIVPAAIFGDLLESLFKRSLGVKDSGKIMPGHGGILDRFDASFFTIPFFLMWMNLYEYFFKFYL